MGKCILGPEHLGKEAKYILGLLGTSGKRGNNLDEGVLELMVEDSVEMGGTVKGPTDDTTCKVFLIFFCHFWFCFCLRCPQRSVCSLPGSTPG